MQICFVFFNADRFGNLFWLFFFNSYSIHLICLLKFINNNVVVRCDIKLCITFVILWFSEINSVTNEAYLINTYCKIRILKFGFFINLSVETIRLPAGNIIVDGSLITQTKKCIAINIISRAQQSLIKSTKYCGWLWQFIKSCNCLIWSFFNPNNCFKTF
jgi:hypothetical protein